MNKPIQIKEFEKSVKNKFDIYNSLFLNLPFQGIEKLGMLIPILQQECKNGLDAGKEPIDILDSFFKVHTSIISESEKTELMFKFIQYVERQIVLFDSVEEAAFENMKKFENEFNLENYIHHTIVGEENTEIEKKLSDFSVRIVFTSHPTQFYTPAVLDIISRLRSFIAANDSNNIDIILQQLGLTSLINSEKPTPLDEAKNVIYFIRNFYYDAVGELYSHIKSNLLNDNFDNPRLIQLGFWPGGDRDGNPFVTWDTTIKVADELRTTLMKCYYRDVKALERKLTFKGVTEIIENLRERLYVAMFDSSKNIEYAEILVTLEKIHVLLTTRFNSLYVEELRSLIDKVKVFKNHFASLDIRQNHIVHKKIVETIFKKEKIIDQTLDELKNNELTSILINKNINITPDQLDDDVLKDTIKTISKLKDIQRKNGEAGCNRYIISNAEDSFSVLFVFFLLKNCGWQKGPIPFDIIPLFESMNGMKNSEFIMKELYSIPEYRAHLNNRGDKQTIMLGFSDGTKDGGYLQANWSIFKTKEKLSQLSSQFNIKPIFFDGRGGPPARGGGKTHRFYASQSGKIANHEIQLTVQGQTISSKFGSKEHFKHHCEQIITAGISQGLSKKENKIADSSRKLIEELARLSFEKYTELKNHKMFIPYLENKSTLKYYGQTNVGSRPDRRGNKNKLNLSDLRAIPFVGSWSQLKQNVPGYFGIGTALKNLVNAGRLNDLKKIFVEVPFFKALILNSMMSLSKCYFELTAYIVKDADYSEFWNILFEEYKLSKEMVLLISGYENLMEEELVTRSSIEIREKIVIPLLTIQQYALQKIEKDPSNKSVYEKIVRRSLYGNINASRNSA